MKKIALLASMVLLPAAAHATVLINEVAWMGSADNANAEWIELTSTDSTPTDLTGWKITSSTGAPSIILAGSIRANGFFLLERTSDATVPSVTADQIYSGALSNSGATLTLTDANGNQVDQVVGGDNWSSIGGDNATKDTAQHTATGWVTAPG